MSSKDDAKLDIGKIGSTPATQGATGADAVQRAQATEGAQGADAVADITEALAAGEIDAVEAQRRLIESVVAEQLPSDASPELEAAIRAEVEAMLADDPTMRALLTP